MEVSCICNYKDLFVLEDEKFEIGIVYNKQLNNLKQIPRHDVSKIKKWFNAFNNNELSETNILNLEEFCKLNFGGVCERSKLSESNINVTGEILELRLMIQLGCNLKCKYCYADEGTYGIPENIILTTENAQIILDKLIKKGINKIEHISFFGGEPNIYYETIIFVLDYTDQLFNQGKLKIRPQFYLVTNGTFFTEKFVEKLKEYNVNITVSLDGSKEIHDKLRVDKNNQGTFDIIKNNIEMLKRNNIPPVMIEATYTTLHESLNMTRESILNYIESLTNVPLVLIADCVGNEYSPKKNTKLSEKSTLDSINKVMLGTVSTQSEYDALNLVAVTIKQLFNKKIEKNIHCSAGYQSISINGNGDYYPCHRYTENVEFKLGNILNDEGELELQQSHQKDTLPECRKCWASQFCNGCTWEMQKNYEKEMALCNERRKIYKHIILSYINLSESQKELLKDNMRKHRFSKSMPLINQ